MKKFFTPLSLIIVCLFAMGQSSTGQTLKWAKSYGGPAKDKGRDIGVDKLGNSYVTGFFTDSAQFGSQWIYAVGDSIDEDIFIAKFDEDGNALWAHGFGNGIDDHTDFPYGFSTNDDGFCAITGLCSNYIKFEKGDSIASNNLNDMMLVLFNTDGSLLWAKVGGWSDYVQYGSGVFLSNDGTIYCIGNYTNDTLNLFGDTLLTYNDAQKHFYVASYAIDGSLNWVKSYSSDYSLESRDIKGDENGNLYIGGNFASTATIESATINSMGSEDGFIMKITTSGDFQWIKTFGSSVPNSSESAYTLAVDTSNNLYVASIFNNNITFDGNTITTGSKHNIAVAAFGADGVYKWANTIVGSENALFSTFCLGLLAEDNVIVTGCFTGEDIVGGVYTIVPTGPDPIYSDVLYAAFNPIDGQVQWARNYGGNDTDAGFGLAGNHSGFGYAAGNFHYEGYFGPYTLISDGISDGFILKFFQNDATAIPSEISQVRLTAFPVPSTGRLNVAIPGNANSIKFTDALGRILFEKEVSGMTTEVLDLSSYTDGAYYLQVNGPSSIYAVKVILQK